jgi:enamine deaminase RidA (YjgF/YER057c/UK114 family)
VVLTASPASRGPFRQQVDEVLAQVRCILDHQEFPVMATMMTVFLRDPVNEPECRIRVQTWFGDLAPVTTIVAQPPCDGSALAVELWAAGGPNVTIDRFGADLCTVQVDGIRWAHCRAAGDVQDGFRKQFEQVKRGLAQAGVGFENVIRTWICIDELTAAPQGESRYQELNRVRADFYRDIHFGAPLRPAWLQSAVYPASTATGMRGGGMTLNCLAIASERPDVFVLPLENPRQASAHPRALNRIEPIPRFSRAMAVGHGQSLTTFVSGTAGVVDFRTLHPDDPVRQTGEAIDHIERLISPESFGRHGLPGAGAALADLAMARVYIQREADFKVCRTACERRLGPVPTTYIRADICRPDLLVEIEAIAVSPLRGNVTQRRL